MKNIYLAIAGMMLCTISARAVKVDDLVGDEMNGYQIMYGGLNYGYAILWNNPIKIEKVSDTEFNIKGALKGKHICPVTLTSDSTVSIKSLATLQPINDSDTTYIMVGETESYEWNPLINNSIGGTGAWQPTISLTDITGTVKEGTGVLEGAHVITFTGVGIMNMTNDYTYNFPKVEIVVYPTNATVSERVPPNYEFASYRIWAKFDEDNNFSLLNLGEWMLGYNNQCSSSTNANTVTGNVIMSKVLNDSTANFGVNSPLPMYTVGQDSIYAIHKDLSGTQSSMFENTDKVKTYSFMTEPMGGYKCALSYGSPVHKYYGNGFATNGGTCLTVCPLQLYIPIYGVAPPDQIEKGAFWSPTTHITSTITFDDEYREIDLGSSITSCTIEPVDIKTSNKFRVNCNFRIRYGAEKYINNINIRLVEGNYTEASQVTDEVLQQSIVLDTLSAYGVIGTPTATDYIYYGATPTFTPKINVRAGDIFNQDYTVFLQVNFLADIGPTYCNLTTVPVSIVTSTPELENDDKVYINDDGVEVKSDADTNVDIYDVMGRMIYVGHTNMVIPLPLHGIYIVKCGTLHQKVMR